MKFSKISLPKLPKMPKTVTKVLENKYVLYFVFFLALTNLFGYMILGNMHAIIFFILAGFLCTYFTKNMIITLSIPIVLTSVLMIGQKVKESFTSSSNGDSSSSPESSSPESSSPSSSSPSLSMPSTNDNTNLDNPNIVYPQPSEDENADNADVDEPMTTMYNRKNNRVDYASTIEDAYGDLNKILGGDGIKNLTSDTQKLMNQQLQLAEAMKSMSPLLESAKGLLQGFDMKNLGSLSSLAKNFNMNGASLPSGQM